MDAVKEYWESFWDKRTELGSQNDLFFQTLSFNTISKFLNNKEAVLSVGCGDGSGFDKYIEKVEKIVGIDYSEAAIKKARQRYELNISQGSMDFFVCNLLRKEPRLVGKFDTVISERCLCNLDTKENQKLAIGILKDYLKPSGRAIICEPSLQGYDTIDKVRKVLGLAPLKRHWHNLLLDENILNNSEFFEVKQRYTFGVYTLLSRVFYPVFIYPEEPKFNHEINKIAAEICEKIMMEEVLNDIPGQHILYVLQRIK